MAGKGGGAWKVAYADFVTAMMAFFLVMWITSQDADTREAISHYFQDPFGSGAHHEPGSTSVASEMKHRFPGVDHRQVGGHNRHRGDAGPQVSPDPHAQHAGLIYRKSGNSDLGVTVLFEEGSAALTPRAEQQLDEILPTLLGKMHRVEIRGHTSRRPLASGGPFANPWQLSYTRCMATMDYLVKKGLEADRIRLSQSAGHEPMLTGLEPQSLRYNSRVEVLPLPEILEEPSSEPVGPASAPHGDGH
ncbi:MAG: flagellar motor protein MotB [Pirellulales bacterium]